MKDLWLPPGVARVSHIGSACRMVSPDKLMVAACVATWFVCRHVSLFSLCQYWHTVQMKHLFRPEALVWHFDGSICLSRVASFISVPAWLLSRVIVETVVGWFAVRWLNASISRGLCTARCSSSCIAWGVFDFISRGASGQILYAHLASCCVECLHTWRLTLYIVLPTLAMVQIDLSSDLLI